ncbi:carboxymuconolactone decarboxylase family protein [Leucobacter chinensis]|uniref:carboxymuconolactone decarboxylase family protein n=1 Tax=Leucobacter chinensis TaxID=2851010 RepID=UPI001C23ADBA|nr:carboxymuconolactone decarboxylase family protein [Leucobacter chinensis]
MKTVNLGKVHPELYKQLGVLNGQVSEAAKDCGLEASLIELVKIRISQINGCAFCLRLHTRDALRNGETNDRLAVLPAWWESQYFTEKEKAALYLAEQVTQLPKTSQTMDPNVLTAEQLSAVAWISILMNAWNRIAIQSGYEVSPG